MTPFHEEVTWGAWLSFLILGTASLISLWSTVKPSYAKLHTSMGLNMTGIVTLLGILYGLRRFQVGNLVAVLEKSKLQPSTRHESQGNQSCKIL